MKKTVTAATAAALMIALTLQTGAGAVHAATAQPAASKPAVSAAVSAKTKHADAIYNHMMELLKKPAKQAEALAYMEKNMYQVTPYQAMLMALKMENAENANLEAWNQKFYKDNVQRSLMKLMKQGDDLTSLIHKTSDKNLKALFKGALDSGYRLETAEGMFYLVLDYPRFQKVRPYVTNDIKSYIDIMTAETKNRFASDAALSISWQEVIKRAQTQEAFVKSYPKSNRVPQVKALYQLYLSISMNGLNNTPMFDYNSKKIDPKAKAALEAAVSKGNPATSGYLKRIKGFLDVVNKNKDTLTPEVRNYIHSALK